MTYTKALNQVLEGAGFHVFEKRGQNWEWRREGDDYLDQVSTYLTNDLRGVWIDLGFWDWATRAIIHPAAERQPYGGPTVAKRLNNLLGTPEPFVRSDPEEPVRAAVGVRDVVLPLFDDLHTPEGLKANLAWVGDLRWGNTDSRVHYAILLWRSGDKERACRLLEDPPKAVARRDEGLLARMRKMICESSPPADIGGQA